MEKLVTLKFGTGSLEVGYAVTLQIGDEQSRPTVEMEGSLPPAPTLGHTYQRWQTAYRRLGLPFRLEARPSFATNVSLVGDCREVSQQLSRQLNQWLEAESFRPLQDKLLERLDPRDTVRLIVQTQDPALQRLPWPAWSFCDRYPRAEIAFSAPAFELVDRRPPSRPSVRVLAILGHSQGIDVDTDQRLLNHLPQAHIEVLEQPSRQQLNDALWDPKGWDILFFAGHSTSQGQESEVAGRLFINPSESLTLPELKHALNKSLERGLQIAIFNSCDGLGLAQALVDLHIPQVLVMREPVPDRIAHEFLKAFLAAFARGESFYLAVREAREKLQGLEHQFPCASWLAAIFQNPAEPPPTWATLAQPQAVDPTLDPQTERSQRRVRTAMTTLAVAAIVLGLRQIGLLQSWELQALDRLMQWRPAARPDPRLLVVTITEADVQAQDPNDRRGSLSDQALSQLLATLQPMEPRLIGLDIYRDFPVRNQQPDLARQMRSADNFFAVCKSSFDGDLGIAPPPEPPPERLGFSDFFKDPDNVLRRQLLYMLPEPNSLCQADYAFATRLALRYLAQEGLPEQKSEDGFLQVGDVVFRPLEQTFGGYQSIDAGGHQIMLNYRPLNAPEQIAERVPLGDVLEGRVSAASVRDRIVLVGTTAGSFGDYWQTPYPGSSAADREAAGVLMQAHMVSHLLSAVLDDQPLIQAWPNSVEMLWIGSWAGVGGVLAYWATAAGSVRAFQLKLLLGILAAEAGLLGLSWVLLVQTGYWVPLIPAALALAAIAAIAVLIVPVPVRKTS
ncbi:sensor protein Chase2 [filamentous cyanobacterium CCT1]|nr:sensor protein Chase2 [filamentous cyanobacterium CCT1]PSN77899.1 sensor protein Chase2 [filamentous cyanobacterium CCP4]